MSLDQKSELWRRGKDGETLSDIGRALGKHAAFGVWRCRGEEWFFSGEPTTVFFAREAI